MSTTTTLTYADVVDLDRYPINDLDSDRGRAFVADCREQLRRDGVCNLPGFVTTQAGTEMIRHADQLGSAAHSTDNTHTIYFEPTDTSVPATHPLAAQQRSAKKTIACDQIPADAPIRRLYESDDLTKFIAAVLGKTELYRSADPLDAVMIALFEDGDELGWHFDRSEFAVTVMYQEAENGGHFDYYPGLRSAENDNHQTIEKTLQSDGDGAVRLPSGPGALAIFHGRNALHRVSPIAGSRPRINSVLTYGEKPDMRLNTLTQDLFYGRTQ
ncbi:2OG-Fe(II) oxygenase family protein [Mycobacterium sp. AZCC_0083]|uniref:2OG-Fe(II) oxygenase family protein n=1 Tax=Mycobacterium sp. AZCC_0083 TaxID=2735882 RepID=UPI00160E397D|nr:2OG-Fe(II) oxygenase family protein [Mycobacterium sp. AZCC_0083]MBB5165684.1 alkylated DNA repair dioxygenase AlkB [Mycobacterium sp. AZCC_0083]